MATNRSDTLDPALLRPGRLDRKIEFPLPDRRQKRLIFSTITGKMNLSDEVDLEDCILLTSFCLSVCLVCVSTLISMFLSLCICVCVCAICLPICLSQCTCHFNSIYVRCAFVLVSMCLYLCMSLSTFFSVYQHVNTGPCVCLYVRQ